MKYCVSVFVLLFVVCVTSGRLVTQTDPTASAVSVEHPAGTSITIEPEFPEFPGGTPPQGWRNNFLGWNTSLSELDATTTSTTEIIDSTAFSKLQSATVSCVINDSECEGVLECKGTAKSGGFVEAKLLVAVGNCEAAAYSKTQVVYGDTAETEDSAAVALAEGGNALIGTTVSFLGVGAGITTTYTVAGSSSKKETLGNMDTGDWAVSSDATINYVQKGSASYSFAAATLGNQATVDVATFPKGDAEVEFRIKEGTCTCEAEEEECEPCDGEVCDCTANDDLSCEGLECQEEGGCGHEGCHCEEVLH